MSFSPNKSPDIFIKGLTLEYRHHLLFKDFNLHLPAGSWTCLLGASGVGKSTLLKLLAGLPTGANQSADTAQIALTGRVAYMAQQDLLMPWLNVLDNCLIGYRLRGQSVSMAERNRAISLLEQVDMGNAIKLPISQLSGGMRQRVALVRTLLEERPIVLMDEPFSALDTISRLKLQDLAAELLKGKTVLLVTHDPLEALRLADRVLVLRDAPAQASEVLTLTSPRPRSPQDPQILERQGQLFSVLAQ